ncbi:MAG: FkbM family methyltransferase [Candidatus Curtissbacteria bacterium]|nr:FkbM family methyltransferase [Candidatus Curtissbacteria bacterium]
MSSFEKINSNPLLVQYLLRKKILKDEPVRLVDVGARGGREYFWEAYKPYIEIIGFDPDRAECLRLNKYSDNKTTYFPYALWETAQKKKFYVTKNLPSSSFLKARSFFLQRFPDEVNLRVKKVIEVQTTTLDTFAKDNEVPYVDFIKLDIEGGELFALKGAVETLSKNVLGVSAEIAFSRTLESQPLFSDLDVFLRNLGFELFDLSPIRLGRKSIFKSPGIQDSGQVISAHVLYFRDAVGEILKAKNSRSKFWNEVRLLKLASFMEIFGLIDCSIEVLQTARRLKLVGDKDTGEFLVKVADNQKKKSETNRTIKDILSSIIPSEARDYIRRAKRELI